MKCPKCGSEEIVNILEMVAVRVSINENGDKEITTHPICKQCGYVYTLEEAYNALSDR